MFYERLKSKADDLLNRRGTSFTVISYDASNNETVKGSPKGIMGPVKIENVPASVVEQSEATITATSAVEIDKDDYIRFDNELYKIVYINKIKPTTVTIIYEIFVTK